MERLEMMTLREAICVTHLRLQIRKNGSKRAYEKIKAIQQIRLQTSGEAEMIQKRGGSCVRQTWKWQKYTEISQLQVFTARDSTTSAFCLEKLATA